MLPWLAEGRSWAKDLGEWALCLAAAGGAHAVAPPAALQALALAAPRDAGAVCGAGLSQPGAAAAGVLAAARGVADGDADGAGQCGRAVGAGWPDRACPPLCGAGACSATAGDAASTGSAGGAVCTACPLAGAPRRAICLCALGCLGRPTLSPWPVRRGHAGRRPMADVVAAGDQAAGRLHRPVAPQAARWTGHADRRTVWAVRWPCTACRWAGGPCASLGGGRCGHHPVSGVAGGAAAGLHAPRRGAGRRPVCGPSALLHPRCRDR
jgi:hypothetical protein